MKAPFKLPVRAIAHKHDKIASAIVENDEDQSIVVEVINWPDWQDIAAYIVTAVNNHESLVAALETINSMSCYASEENTDSRESMLLEIGKQSRAALAAIKEP